MKKNYIAALVSKNNNNNNNNTFIFCVRSTYPTVVSARQVRKGHVDLVSQMQPVQIRTLLSLPVDRAPGWPAASLLMREPGLRGLQVVTIGSAGFLV